MKVTVLMENTACCDALASGHGLSLYIETQRHKILVDMGPDDGFAGNAERMGIDLAAVDVAVLSHGHYDHAGGLEKFCQMNERAVIYIHQEAFGDFVIHRPGEDLQYIGVDQALDRTRFTLTGSELVIDEELTLFSGVPDTVGALEASALLYQRTETGLCRDSFAHEQNLLIRSNGKTVLVAGCAHRGITNILQAAEQRLGYRPDVTFGGFHLFQLTEEDPKAAELICKTGQTLLEGTTVYYTGHCTGDYAYQMLKNILGERLQPMSGGKTVEI